MPAQIAAILAHELVHAAVGIAAGHGKAFKRIALGLGLVRPMRATTPGDVFLATITPILAGAGPLPHARLDTGGETTRSKKQALALAEKMRLEDERRARIDADRRRTDEVDARMDRLAGRR